ncbi:MATE family efflux transporter [Sinomonas sp. ASV322]|uniref:MATE family efflux transporter n=1 Tax=Sinomonas sp. ASV322 TaxID=3041920 RepID=UPI0027DD487A|nr:MATE family efflux transporter [Sinomonas sp. ASV322]MDQ4502977.1 MATE family efflux transporter [Sinomonas sp. ASV322]
MTSNLAAPIKRRVWVVNGAANLVRAASGSLENLLLPLILLWLLPKDQYGAWAIVFSVSTYVTYLDLGLQTAVQTNVARWAGSNDPVGAARMAWTGVKVALIVGGVAFVALATAARALGSIFPDVPAGFLQQAAEALVLLAVGQVANLSINVLASYYAGHQRSVFPALLMSSARLVSLLSIVVVGSFEQQLPAVATAYSLPLVAGFLTLLIAFLRELRRLARDSDRVAPVAVVGSRVGHLLRYSGPLMIWNVCTLAVSAAGTAIVGRVDFGAVVIYSISTMFVLAIVGVDNAVMSPLLSELGRLAVAGDRSTLGRTAVKATRINSAILAMLICISCVVVAVLANTGRFTGQRTDATIVAILLIMAAAIRITMTPLTFAFISTGDHRRIVAQPVLDALINLVLSIGLGLAFGVIGVVVGGVLSGAISVVLGISWSRRAARFRDIVTAQDIVRSVGEPMMCILPAIAMTLVAPGFAFLGSIASIIIVAAASSLSLSLVWFRSLPRDVRTSLAGDLLRRRRMAKT